jgi:hypothetical protein
VIGTRRWTGLGRIALLTRFDDAIPTDR